MALGFLQRGLGPIESRFRADANAFKNHMAVGLC